MNKKGPGTPGYEHLKTHKTPCEYVVTKSGSDVAGSSEPDMIGWTGIHMAGLDFERKPVLPCLKRVLAKTKSLVLPCLWELPSSAPQLRSSSMWAVLSPRYHMVPAAYVPFYV